MSKNGAMTVGQAFSQSITLMNAGRYAEAKKICEDIKRVRPLEPDVHNLLGGLAFKMGHAVEATTHFSRVLELKPDHNEARLNLARVLRDLQQWTEAATHFEHLASTAGNNADILMDCARVQVKAKQYDDAIRTFEKAIAVHPLADLVQTELAEAFLKKGDITNAEKNYTAILARTPTYPYALINLAVVRDIQGRMDEVLVLQEDAIRADPNNADAHTHHGLALLARERFTEGWDEYAWRFRRTHTTTLHDRFDMPYWEGEPLQGRHLLIWTEQGPGDEILIASMIPNVLAQGAKCTLVCTARLASLFRRSFPSVDILLREHIVAGTAKAPGADFQASLSHLGRSLRQGLPAFPSEGAYLKADPELTDHLRTGYQAGVDKPLIGISWRSANPAAESEKSTTLADWTDLLSIPDLRFVSLQYGHHTPEIEAAKKATGAEIIVDPSVDPLTDLDRFAAQVAAMDLVISVSNTTVHVAGGLGRPVWTLVPASVGRIWYWFLERTNSPWYPSMRLFRQNRGAGWTPVLSEVARALALWR